MRKPLIDRGYDTGIEITSDYDLTETVAQRDADYVMAFCITGLGHDFEVLETEDGDSVISDREVVECVNCGTIVARPKPEKRED